MRRMCRRTTVVCILLCLCVNVRGAGRTVKLLTVDTREPVAVEISVDIDATLAKAVRKLSGNASDAHIATDIRCELALSEDTAFDTDGLYLYLTETAPLPVAYTREEVARVTLQFPTRFVEDDTLYAGEIVVDTPGVRGEATELRCVSYLSGVETGSEQISYTVLKNPVTRVLRVGTLEKPEWWPTGHMIQPAEGRLTSDYGKRRWEFHTGIDIANKRGTPIVAADSGTVIFSGRMGNYGKYVQIDHNGIVSAYAHNSKLLVAVGDHVIRGQTIALMGSTGRSTGSHCHFEILIGYEFQNPHDYVTFRFENNAEKE